MRLGVDPLRRRLAAQGRQDSLYGAPPDLERILDDQGVDDALAEVAFQGVGPVEADQFHLIDQFSVAQRGGCAHGGWLGGGEHAIEIGMCREHVLGRGQRQRPVRLAVLEVDDLDARILLGERFLEATLPLHRR